MRIEWNLMKKRGNMRPQLHYTVTLEEHEKALALPPVAVMSTIPKPEEAWQTYCYPGQFERSGREDREFHTLEIPSHKGQSWQYSLCLPWRRDNEYPEVEESFLLLRAAFEKELADAYASLPIKTACSLETSDTAKANIAPGILAERFLKMAVNNMDQGS